MFSPILAPKCNIKIKTLAPLESPECEISNGGDALILHFDTQNRGELNYPL